MPLLWLSAAFFVGLILNGSLRLAVWMWVLLLTAGGLLLVIEILYKKRFRIIRYWRKVAPVSFGALIIALAIGMARFPVSVPKWTPTQLPFYNGLQEVSLIGRVESMPENLARYTRFTFSVEQFSLADDPSVLQEVSGVALVKVPLGMGLRYGDRLELHGELKTPPEGETFNYREYLAQHGIFTLVSYPDVQLLARNRGNPFMTVMNSVRGYAYETIQKILPANEAALLCGILLGIDSDIPPSLVRAYQQTGTAHIVAISGFNIAIIAGIFTFLFRRFLVRWKAAIFSIIGIFLYTVLVGASPSVLRAAIMGSLGIVGGLIGRRSAGLNLLAFTAAIMCLFNPFLPWDISFQLSFLATLGILLFADPLNDWLGDALERRFKAETARKIAKPIGDYFLLTLAAQAMTLPVLAYHFQRISFSSVIANPLILPIQPAVMTLGGIATLMGMIWLPLGKLIGYVAYPLIAYTNWMTTVLARLPGSLSLEAFSLWVVIGFYLLMFAWLVLLPRFKKWLLPVSWMLILTLASLGIGVAAFQAKGGLLHVRIFNGSTPPALMIQTPDGKRILINGMPNAKLLTDELYRFLPALDRHLDALVVTTTDPTTVDAIDSAVRDFPVDMILWDTQGQGNTSTRWLEFDLHQYGTGSVLLQPGDMINLDTGMSLLVDELSKDSPRLILQYENVKFSFPDNLEQYLTSAQNDKGWVEFITDGETIGVK